MGREGSGSEGPRIGIGAVARRTGLSAHVLRAWERRYGVVAPARSAGGERLYSGADVARLDLLRRATEGGHAIGRVATLSTDELRELVGADEQAGMEARSGMERGGVADHMEAALAAVEALDAGRIHATLTRAVVDLPSRDFVDGLVVPLLRKVGELWAAEAICTAHERVLSVNLRRVLAWLIDTATVEPDAPLLLGTTPSGQRHELGAMLVAVIAAEAGWRVAYLGPDLPAGDIAVAAAALGASVVALSVLQGGDVDPTIAEIGRLRSLLGAEVPLLVGGSGIRRHAPEVAATGVVHLADLDALRGFLRSTEAGSAAGASLSGAVGE